MNYDCSLLFSGSRRCPNCREDFGSHRHIKTLFFGNELDQFARSHASMVPVGSVAVSAGASANSFAAPIVARRRTIAAITPRIMNRLAAQPHAQRSAANTPAPVIVLNRRARSRTIPTKFGYEIVQCVVCGKRFMSHDNGQITCSQKCFSRLQ